MEKSISKRPALLLAALILLTAIPAAAQNVHGRLFTSFYSWEREIYGTDAQRYTQLYNGAIVNVNGIGGRDMAFHTYVRFGNAFGDDALELDHRLYNAFFEWNNIGGRFDAAVGRQFIWAGVGNGRLDGFKGEYDLNKWGKVGAYVGTLVPLRESWKVDSWTESHMIGAYYKGRYYDTDMQVSWVRKNREPVTYAAPGQYTGRRLEVSSLEAHLAGLDLSRRFGDMLTVFMRTEATLRSNENTLLQNDFDFDRFELSGDFTPTDKLTVTGQYFYRNPRQNLNSIFSIFSSTHNQEFWLNAYYNVAASYSVYGGIALVDYDGDDTKRLNLGFTGPYFSVGGNKFLGYSGNLDNYYLTGRYPVMQNLWVKGSFSIGRYKIYDEAADYNNLVTSSAGVTFQPRRSMTLDVEGQAVKNPLTNRDLRLFARFNYWFFMRNILSDNEGNNR